MISNDLRGDATPGKNLSEIERALSPEISRLLVDPYAQGAWIESDEDAKERIDLNRYWRILLKHKWIVIGVLVLSLAVGVAVTLMTTPIYRASTTLQIDRESAKIVNVQTVDPAEQMIAGDEFFQTEYGRLKSRRLAVLVVDSLNLASNDNFYIAMGGKVDWSKTAPSEVPAKRRLNAINAFTRQLSVAPVRGSRLVNVSFDSPDRRIAAQLANATAENYISDNLNRRFEQSAYARQFLEERLAQQRVKLEDSQRQLVAYATQQQIINVQTGGEQGSGAVQSLTAANLVALNTALAGARGERIKAEERWRQAQGSALSLGEVLKNPTIQDLTQAKAKAQAEYEDKGRVLKPDHPEMQQIAARVTELERQVQIETRNVQNSYKIDYDVALNQERAFERQVDQLKGSVMDLRNRSIQYDILQREVDTNQTLYDGLLQRYKEIGISGGIGINNISIVDRAEVPIKPSRPRPALNLAMAAFAGLAFGVLIAFLIELLDESIGTPEDVEAKLGVPLLGSVPKLDRKENPVSAMEDVRSPMSEAYYSIRTALQFSTPNGAPSSIVVTSSRPSEGKSTSSLAIARGFARLGRRVLLIDGDLRNPSMHRHLGVSNDVGLSKCLTGSASLASVIQPTDVPTLNFVPCGTLPPNPAELLAGPHLKNLIQEATGLWDVVIIDGPPVLGLTDAPILAAAVEGVVFAVEASATRRSVAKIAMRRLKVGNARIVGIILTKFNAKKASYGSGYGYAYDYNYGSRPHLTSGKSATES